MKAELGTIQRFDGPTGPDTHIPDDEALIFLNDDNEQTIHVQCPGAHDVARKIVAALNSQ